MGTEVEVKFLADGEAPLASLAEADTLGPARLGSAVTVDELDVYLDTATGHLAAAGWACRHRDRGRGPIVSLKGPAREGGADGDPRPSGDRGTCDGLIRPARMAAE